MDVKSGKNSQKEIQKRSIAGGKSNIITPKGKNKKDQEVKKKRISTETPKLDTPNKASSDPSK